MEDYWTVAAPLESRGDRGGGEGEVVGLWMELWVELWVELWLRTGKRVRVEAGELESCKKVE